MHVLAPKLTQISVWIRKLGRLRVLIMSRSQIHVYTYVLRHAWLNLLSEHITAGRINQVTKKKSPFHAHLSMKRESRINESRPERQKPRIRSFSHETSHNRKADRANI